MAGLIDGEFKEKLSPFLKSKVKDPAISLQYCKSPLETTQCPETNRRHYEAEVSNNYIERLYRKCAVIDLTMICAANCRYCLRSSYPIHTMSDPEIYSASLYCGSEENKRDINEILVTGGDPLIVPKKLNYLIDCIEENAPNVHFVRIGSRLASQEPDRVDESVLNIFRSYTKIKFEIGTQINHPIELYPEVINALQSIQDAGARIYAQNVLLKGVNNNIDTLVSLYNTLRELDIDPHYLFHCIPMKGIHHFRTSITTGLDLIKELTCSGEISGRAKPMFAAMTDIGKITFYEGTIEKCEVDENGTRFLLLKSDYSYKDRIKWNPEWKLPDNAFISGWGTLNVWYIDGQD